MKITITQEDNDRSLNLRQGVNKRNYCQCCPLALAMERTLGGVWTVNGKQAYLQDESDGACLRRYSLSDELERVVHVYDLTKLDDLKPILGTFDVYPVLGL